MWNVNVNFDIYLYYKSINQKHRLYSSDFWLQLLYVWVVAWVCILLSSILDPHPVLRAPPDFQTLRRPWINCQAEVEEKLVSEIWFYNFDKYVVTHTSISFCPSIFVSVHLTCSWDQKPKLRILFYEIGIWHAHEVEFQDLDRHCFFVNLDSWNLIMEYIWISWLIKYVGLRVWFPGSNNHRSSVFLQLAQVLIQPHIYFAVMDFFQVLLLLFGSL